tara:strand:+ start:262 stop:435 length:174 start_codon:yes stop_codon:yes gene_type:complete
MGTFVEIISLIRMYEIPHEINILKTETYIKSLFLNKFLKKIKIKKLNRGKKIGNKYI